MLEDLAGRELIGIDASTFQFHDLQHAFLLLRAGDVRLLHADLLAAYRHLIVTPNEKWSMLPLDEPYIWEHLLDHLRAVGDTNAMRTGPESPSRINRNVNIAWEHSQGAIGCLARIIERCHSDGHGFEYISVRMT